MEANGKKSEKIERGGLVEGASARGIGKWTGEVAQADGASRKSGTREKKGRDHEGKWKGGNPENPDPSQRERSRRSKSRECS